MPIFYESLSDSLRDWALHQSMFFVSSAPLHGQHINLSPKGLPDSSFAVLSPNKVAYVDSTGSGCETICHLRENGRATVMFCSFDKTPRIMRLFCTGSVIEWDEPEFVPYLQAMGGKSLLGARAVIVLDIFKVQLSCGFGVPKLALTFDAETNEAKPCFENRSRLGEFAQYTVDRGEMMEYQVKWNSRSLDGLPGLHSALRKSGHSIWWAHFRNWGIGVASSSCPRLRRAGHYRSPPSAEKYQGIAPTPGPFMLLPETSMESDPGSITLPISSRDKGKAVARSASASSSHPMPALIKIPIKSPRKAPRKAPSHIPLTSLWTALWMQELIGNDVENVESAMIQPVDHVQGNQRKSYLRDHEPWQYVTHDANAKRRDAF
ncbi:hypothetical protein PENPOL_c021G01153 [Penicillium polonicum]|uniref:Pyridoxamine 5'-phosphate oxidase putative domain-containing protein n=1 Tax=Penicillium polonicum TaxID=60169 RepID=A0A1V6N808_PENPO|nr:hypothetical protein PENPOL_c021G01153 [Penicillium polonicum]